MVKSCKILCVALALILMLTGCAKQEPVTTEPTTTAQEQPQESYSLTLGSKIPDITVTTAQGQSIRIYDLLEEKKMVMLNFWFADCIWCIREFPVMEVAYQSYKQDVEILALSPYDSKETIVAFKQDHSLSFPMGQSGRDLVMGFGVGSYPTSVVIDREGYICLIHSGAITETQVFKQLFNKFIADDYTLRIYHSINDLL